jgi:hypothetical protein
MGHERRDFRASGKKIPTGSQWRLMKLKVKCDVQSDVILHRGLEFKADDKTYRFEIDSKGIWNSITIIAEMKDSSKTRWGTLPVEEPRAPNQAPFNVVGEFEPGLFEGVIADFQCLESALSLYMPLRQISWRFPETDVIFEEGEERTMGHLGAVKVGRGKISPQIVSENMFVTLLGIGLKAYDITVVTSFWREGENDWIAGKFINAFFNYYFTLEGLYGNKKTKNRQIEEEMMKSPGLLAQMERFNQGQHPVEHLRQLGKMLNGADVPTSEDLIGLLVSTRGKLHHFQNNPNREQGSPLVHDKYEGIAYLARQLAHGSILELTRNIKPMRFGPCRLD